MMQRTAFSEEESLVGDRTFAVPIIKWEHGQVFGLSTDLLIEVLLWASGVDARCGARRLDNLLHFRKHKKF